MLNRIEAGVTAPLGFEAGCAAAGIKYKDRTDMAIVYSKRPCVAAGAFTTNVVKAAPVLWDKHIVEDCENLQAVIINAGIANACTGEEGYGYCKQTADAAAKVLNIPADAVGVASTGVIGMQLPIDRIVNGVSLLAAAKGESYDDGHKAARAIMTTDTKAKEVAVEFNIGGTKCTMGGMCKGAGMIHPNMCTMLCFITTDAAIDKALLTKALKNDVVDTFNMISVDGDTSTNDTVLLMANAMAGNPVICEENEDYKTFCEALHYCMLTLSKMIAGDGEGCTCLFECTVVNADTKQNARTLAKSVITSSLTKAAIFGHDANWGRILCALGYSGVDFDPYKVDIYFKSAAGELQIVKDGVSTGYSEDLATEILSQEHVTAVCDMHNGNEQATAFGCDLTYEYVKINGDYRS
ncbi:MAG: bifunctional glutamate N-acetyltransferase/amino-acid acetyltransferase ArgJ [Lachnospiraceae bacterium]|nr:bifunctional glutamate N-acetyltransferase/amino-acid acetyltransferase ArgJ [Lachnospiraceae bacterium]